MSDLKALTRRWFEEVWNNQNASVIDELGDPHMTGHGLLTPDDPETGINRFKKFHRQTLSAFPDLHLTLDQILQDGNFSTTRFYFTATHSGPGMGDSTGKSVTVTAITIIHWHNGKIIEAWNEFDRHGMLQQLA